GQHGGDGAVEVEPVEGAGTGALVEGHRPAVPAAGPVAAAVVHAGAAGLLAAALTGQVEQDAGGAVLGQLGDPATRAEQPPPGRRGDDEADAVPAVVGGHLVERAVVRDRGPQHRAMGDVDPEQLTAAGVPGRALGVEDGVGRRGGGGELLHGITLPDFGYL